MNFWSECVGRLEGDLSPQQFNTWIRPLQIIEEQQCIRLLAPNQFVLNWVRDHYLTDINTFLKESAGTGAPSVSLEIGSKKQPERKQSSNLGEQVIKRRVEAVSNAGGKHEPLPSNLNTSFTFDTFVEGKSNQLARAASMQIGKNPGTAYNPLFIYGGVGLGKTHLMHAVGNTILDNNPSARVVYVHSEGFVSQMVKALQHNKMDEFKRRFRSVNALLIDDVQFLPAKSAPRRNFFTLSTHCLNQNSK